MAGLMVALAIMLIFSTLALQGWENEARRDAEAEMMFRAQDIVRAIVRYRRDFGLTPEKLEDLMEAGPKGQFYLRKLYTDPLVRDGEWGLLYVGPGNQIIDPNGLSAAGIPGLGDPFADKPFGADAERANEPRLDRQLDPRRSQANPQGSPLNPQGMSGAQAGLRLAGVKSLCTDRTFRIYKGKEDYAEWLFTFIDLDRPAVQGGNRNRQQLGGGARRRQRPGRAGGSPRSQPGGGGANQLRPGGGN